MNKILKNNVRYFRQHFGLTQTQLAKLVGCSKNTISSIERYEFMPTAFLALKLCKFFLVPFEILFYFDESSSI